MSQPILKKDSLLLYNFATFRLMFVFFSVSLYDYRVFISIVYNIR